MTLSIITLRIKAFSIKTLSILGMLVHLLGAQLKAVLTNIELLLELCMFTMPAVLITVVKSFKVRGQYDNTFDNVSNNDFTYNYNTYNT